MNIGVSLKEFVRCGRGSWVRWSRVVGISCEGGEVWLRLSGGGRMRVSVGYVEELDELVGRGEDPLSGVVGGVVGDAGVGGVGYAELEAGVREELGEVESVDLSRELRRLCRDGSIKHGEDGRYYIAGRGVVLCGEVLGEVSRRGGVRLKELVEWVRGKYRVSRSTGYRVLRGMVLDGQLVERGGRLEVSGERIEGVGGV